MTIVLPMAGNGMMITVATDDICTREGCTNPRTIWGRTICADHVAEYKREWVRRPEVRARQAAQARARYAADPAYKAAVVKRWESRNQTRVMLIRGAGLYVKWALAMGLLVRPEACEQCGHDGYIEPAHADYLAPFDVRWLCKPCHRQWDRDEPKTNAHV